ncbi:MAG TPA: beta-N-acetylhexosaminidase [Steroidobacteraceae bacterium]|jgi:beta-N-acetylhexosaminidase|nr:beta-N-acetylhexosaminidase [Steroidobacteraceae bacterium]
MSLGPLMIDIAGTELTSEDIKVLSHPLVGSVILFTRNYRDIAQLTALTAAIRAQRSPQLLIAVDHEGGRVQRFREGFTRLPPARLLGRRYDQDRREALNLAQSVGWLMAGELRAVGVDFSFAPCVDLDYGVSEIIGDRAFHKDPDVVAALGIAYMAGMREAGMAAVAKHFPGHGAVIADSHVALPVDRRKYADLEPDIRPYRPLIDNNLAAVMGAHVVFPAVDALPASLSQRWITGVLRRELGFHGCVFADDLSMAGAAAFGGVIERAKHAFAAGCDVLPICNDRQAVQSVLEHFGPEAGTPASQARMVRMRARGEPPTNLNSDRQWQQTVANIADLSAAPPLVLTEEGHDGV